MKNNTVMEDSDLASENIGLEAINNTLLSTYGETKERWFNIQGAESPVEAVRVIKRETPMPHWLYISYGFTELYGKETDVPEYSGFGFELSFRLKDETESDEPPLWPAQLISKLGGYTYASDTVYYEDQHLDLNVDIDDSGTRLAGVVFREDPELGAIDTPNGSVKFLEMVHIYQDEYQAAQIWRLHGILDMLSNISPNGICDLSRDSLLNSSDYRGLINENAAKEGSDSAQLKLEHLRLIEKKSWFRPTKLTIELQRSEAAFLSKVLRGRLLFSRSCMVGDNDSLIILAVSEEPTREFEVGTNRPEIVKERNGLLMQKHVAEELCLAIEEQRTTPLKSWPRLSIKWL